MAAHPESTNDEEVRLNKVEVLVGQLQEWKSVLSGGLRTAIWFIGIIQVFVVLVLGFCINAMVSVSSSISRHDTSLEVMKEKFDSFLSQGPRFTADMAARADFEMEAKIKDWTTQQNAVIKARVDDHETRLKPLEARLK